MSDTIIMRLIVFITAFIFIIFYFIEKLVTVRMEKEETTCKVLAFQQKVMAATIVLSVGVYIKVPYIDAIYLIVMFSLAFIYSYIIGKAYYLLKK